MEMTDEEICESYRRAKNSSKQITILADLNGCKSSEIKEILRNNGYIKQQGKPKATPPEKPLSKAERLLKAVNDEREEVSTVLEEGKKDSGLKVITRPYIPEAVRVALEKSIMDINQQIIELQGQRGEIEHFLGWDEVQKHLEERLV